MSDANEGIEVQLDPRAGDHRVAIGLLAGTALGVGLGMLMAPRKGSELRQQVAGRAKHVAGTASRGYHRARDTAGRYAHRCQDAYCACRDTVARGAHEARRYAREVSGAVKSRKAPELDQLTAPAQVTSEQAGERYEPQKDLRAV
jgi:gas vesicle protein